MGIGNRVTATEIDRIKGLRLSGLTFRQIADEIGRGEDTVRIISMKELGRSRPPAAKHSDETIEAVLIEWMTTGASASAIGAKFGLSRNIIIGIVYRARANGRLPPQFRRVGPNHPATQHPAIRNKRKRPRKKRLEVVKSPTRKDIIKAIVLQPEPFTPLPDDPPLIAGGVVESVRNLADHHCRWPVGDPDREDFGFCGKTKVPGLSYCANHTRRACRLNDPPPAANQNRPNHPVLIEAAE